MFNALSTRLHNMNIAITRGFFAIFLRFWVIVFRKKLSHFWLVELVRDFKILNGEISKSVEDTSGLIRL